jgi:5'-methylthioadenosine phosphorylase
MSTAPEVILANELGIPFAEVALCTRYDSWRISDPPPDGESIRKLAEDNREKIIRLITYALRKIEQ